MGELGYACINETLRRDNPSVYTTRTLKARGFTLAKASRVALDNARDLYTILCWNEDHGIRVFRIGGDLFPRRSENYYDLAQLPDREEIVFNLRRAGQFAEEHEHVLSMHPSQFVVLASPSESVVNNAITDLRVHGDFLDLLNSNLRCVINFHVGGTYGGDFEATAIRFNRNFLRLPENVRSRAAIENDDRVDGWSISRIHHYIYSEVGVPITYDHHHSRFSREAELTAQQEYRLARSSWPNLPCEVHYSESATPPELAIKHSGYLAKKIPNFLTADPKNYIIIEAKAKEMALLDYRKRFPTKGKETA